MPWYPGGCRVGLGDTWFENIKWFQRGRRAAAAAARASSRSSCVGSGTSDMRQLGHVLCSFIHSSMQLRWKMWPHGSCRSTSSPSYSQRHTGHCGSSFSPAAATPAAAAAVSGAAAISAAAAAAVSAAPLVSVPSAGSSRSLLGEPPSLVMLRSGRPPPSPLSFPPWNAPMPGLAGVSSAVLPSFFFFACSANVSGSNTKVGKVCTMWGGTPGSARRTGWPPSSSPSAAISSGVNRPMARRSISSRKPMNTMSAMIRPEIAPMSAIWIVLRKLSLESLGNSTHSW
mmetsp:Transcript_25322/g.74777  ORF Transcript_25322/g.74777 Transcript_25322/m.74777 type:complete len:285 (+) Transcript_25322:1301-2155(+)